MLNRSHTKELVIRDRSCFLQNLSALLVLFLAVSIFRCHFMNFWIPTGELLKKNFMTTFYLFKGCTFGLSGILHIWENKFAFSNMTEIWQDN